MAVAASFVAGAQTTPGGKRWFSHIEVLAADGMEGRDTGSAGHKRAADYVASMFEKARLEPAGAAGYIQPVRFKTRRILESQSLTVESLLTGLLTPMSCRSISCEGDCRW